MPKVTLQYVHSDEAHVFEVGQYSDTINSIRRLLLRKQPYIHLRSEFYFEWPSTAELKSHQRLSDLNLQKPWQIFVRFHTDCYESDCEGCKFYKEVVADQKSLVNEMRDDGTWKYSNRPLPSLTKIPEDQILSFFSSSRQAITALVEQYSTIETIGIDYEKAAPESSAFKEILIETHQLLYLAKKTIGIHNKKHENKISFRDYFEDFSDDETGNDCSESSYADTVNSDELESSSMRKNSSCDNISQDKNFQPDTKYEAEDDGCPGRIPEDDDLSEAPCPPPYNPESQQNVTTSHLHRQQSNFLYPQISKPQLYSAEHAPSAPPDTNDSSPTFKSTSLHESNKPTPIPKRNQAQLQSDFIDAIKNDDLSSVRSLVHNGARINAVDFSDWTPLFYASMYDSKSVLMFLITAGADVHHLSKTGTNAAHIAAEYGSARAIKVLIDAGIAYDQPEKIALDLDPFSNRSVGKTPLEKAARNNRINVLKVLLSYKFSSFNPGLMEAVHSSQYEAAKTLLPHASNQDEALLWALGHEYQMAVYLRRLGATLNTPLGNKELSACTFESRAKTLIQFGAQADNRTANNCIVL